MKQVTFHSLFKWKRAAAFFTCVSFLITSVNTPLLHAEEKASPPAVSASFPSEISAVRIPLSAAAEEDFYQGEKGKTVILVQDAHAVPDAQKNIRRLIEFFQKEYGLRCIAVEGASSALDVRFLKSFPDKEKLEKTAEAFADRGEITGAGLAALFSPFPSRYLGIEDWNLYEQAVRLFLDSMERETAVRVQIEAAARQLTDQKKRAYAPELFELDQALENFESGRGDFAAALQAAAKIRPPEAGSRLALISRFLSKDGRFTENLQAQAASAAARVKKLIESGKFSIPPAETARFFSEYQAFQTSGAEPEAFVHFLTVFSAEHRLPAQLPEEWRDLSSEYGTLQSLEGTRIFSEFQSYTAALKASLLRSEAERELDRRGTEAGLLKKLAGLSLSAGEWTDVKKLDAAGHYPEILSQLKSQKVFYRNAEQRDEVFFRRLKPLLEKEKNVLFVAGGFHTQGLTRILKENRISYKVLRPLLKNVPDEDNYRGKMRGEVLWKKYLSPENGKIDFYKAFMRGSRDQLLSGDSAPALKDWRDEIIRSLAAERRIEKSSEYTAFLDEVSTGAGGRSEPKWQRNLDRIMQRLKDLEAGGKMTQADVLKLLGPGNVLQAAGGNASIVPGSLFTGRSELRVPSLPAITLDRAARGKIKKILILSNVNFSREILLLRPLLPVLTRNFPNASIETNVPYFKVLNMEQKITSLPSPYPEYEDEDRRRVENERLAGPERMTENGKYGREETLIIQLARGTDEMIETPLPDLLLLPDAVYFERNGQRAGWRIDESRFLDSQAEVLNSAGLEGISAESELILNEKTLNPAVLARAAALKKEDSRLDFTRNGNMPVIFVNPLYGMAGNWRGWEPESFAKWERWLIEILDARPNVYLAFNGGPEQWIKSGGRARVEKLREAVFKAAAVRGLQDRILPARPSEGIVDLMAMVQITEESGGFGLMTHSGGLHAYDAAKGRVVASEIESEFAGYFRPNPNLRTAGENQRFIMDVIGDWLPSRSEMRSGAVPDFKPRAGENIRDWIVRLAGPVLQLTDLGSGAVRDREENFIPKTDMAAGLAEKFPGIQTYYALDATGLRVVRLNRRGKITADEVYRRRIHPHEPLKTAIRIGDMPREFEYLKDFTVWSFRGLFRSLTRLLALIFLKLFKAPLYERMMAPPPVIRRNNAVMINSPTFGNLNDYLDEARELIADKGVILLRISSMDWRMRRQGVEETVNRHFWPLRDQGFTVFMLENSEIPEGYPSTPGTRGAPLLVAVRSEMRAALPAGETLADKALRKTERITAKYPRISALLIFLQFTGLGPFLMNWLLTGKMPKAEVSPLEYLANEKLFPVLFKLWPVFLGAYLLNLLFSPAATLRRTATAAGIARNITGGFGALLRMPPAQRRSEIRLSEITEQLRAVWDGNDESFWRLIKEAETALAGNADDKWDAAKKILDKVLDRIEIPLGKLPSEVTRLMDEEKPDEAAELTARLDLLETIQKQIAGLQDELISASEEQLRRPPSKVEAETVSAAPPAQRFSATSGSTYFEEDRSNHHADGRIDIALDGEFRRYLAGFLGVSPEKVVRIGAGMRATVYQVDDFVYKFIPVEGLRDRMESSNLKIDSEWLDGLDALGNYLGDSALPAKKIAELDVPVTTASGSPFADRYILLRQSFGKVLHADFQDLRSMTKEKFYSNPEPVLRLRQIPRILFALQTQLLKEKGTIVFDMGPRNIVRRNGKVGLSDFDLARLVQYDPKAKKFNFYDFFQKLKREDYGAETEEFFLMEFFEKMLYPLVRDAADPDRKFIADEIAEEMHRMSSKGVGLARLFYRLIDTPEKRSELAELFGKEEKERHSSFKTFAAHYLKQNLFAYLKQGLAPLVPELDVDKIRTASFVRSELRSAPKTFSSPEKGTFRTLLPLSEEDFIKLEDRQSFELTGEGKLVFHPPFNYSYTHSHLQEISKHFESLSEIAYGQPDLFEEIARYAEAHSERTVTVVDWGAGAGTSLAELSQKLAGRGIRNVRLVGFSDMYFKDWARPSMAGIEFILDVSRHLPEYFKDGEIDFLYSYWGFAHFNSGHVLLYDKPMQSVVPAPTPFAQYLQKLAPKMAAGGSIISNEIRTMYGSLAAPPSAKVYDPKNDYEIITKSLDERFTENLIILKKRSEMRTPPFGDLKIGTWHGILTDIDLTITDQNRNVSAEAVKRIAELLSKGVRIGFATARPYEADPALKRYDASGRQIGGPRDVRDVVSRIEKELESMGRKEGLAYLDIFPADSAYGFNAGNPEVQYDFGIKPLFEKAEDGNQFRQLMAQIMEGYYQSSFSESYDSGAMIRMPVRKLGDPASGVDIVFIGLPGIERLSGEFFEQLKNQIGSFFAEQGIEIEIQKLKDAIIVKRKGAGRALAVKKFEEIMGGLPFLSFDDDVSALTQRPGGIYVDRFDAAWLEAVNQLKLVPAASGSVNAETAKKINLLTAEDWKKRLAAVPAGWTEGSAESGTISVAGVLVMRKIAGRWSLLLGRRGKGADQPGLYVAPTGQVDTGENYEKAALRELGEETKLVRTTLHAKVPVFEGGKPNVRVHLGIYVDDGPEAGEPPQVNETEELDRYEWIPLDYLLASASPGEAVHALLDAVDPGKALMDGLRKKGGFQQVQTILSQALRSEMRTPAAPYAVWENAYARLQGDYEKLRAAEEELKSGTGSVTEIEQIDMAPLFKEIANSEAAIAEQAADLEWLEAVKKGEKKIVRKDYDINFGMRNAAGASRYLIGSFGNYSEAKKPDRLFLEKLDSQSQNELEKMWDEIRRRYQDGNRDTESFLREELNGRPRWERVYELLEASDPANAEFAERMRRIGWRLGEDIKKMTEEKIRAEAIDKNWTKLKANASELHDSIENLKKQLRREKFVRDVEAEMGPLAPAGKGTEEEVQALLSEYREWAREKRREEDWSEEERAARRVIALVNSYLKELGEFEDEEYKSEVWGLAKQVLEGLRASDFEHTELGGRVLSGRGAAAGEDEHAFLAAPFFSPDGRYLATQSDDKILIREMKSGRTVLRIRRDPATGAESEQHAGDIYPPVFSPDGQYLVTYSGEKALVWDLASKQVVLRIGGNRLLARAESYEHNGSLLRAVFSPDGRYLATLSPDDILLWDVQKKKVVLTVGRFEDAEAGSNRHTMSLFSAYFSPDGRYLLTQSADAILTWDIESGNVVLSDEVNGMASPESDLHGRYLRDAVFSPDSRYLITRSDGKIVMREIATGNVVLKMAARNDAPPESDDQPYFGGVVFSPGGRYVATRSSSKILLHEAATGRVVLRIQNEAAHLTNFALPSFSADGRYVIARTSSQISVYEIETGHRVFRVGKWDDFKGSMPAHIEYFEAAAFSPDGRYLATLAYDQILVRKVETGQIVFRDNHSPIGMAFSPDGRYLAAQSRDQISIWQHRFLFRASKPAARSEMRAEGKDPYEMHPVLINQSAALNLEEGPVRINFGNYWPEMAHVDVKQDGSEFKIEFSGPYSYHPVLSSVLKESESGTIYIKTEGPSGERTVHFFDQTALLPGDFPNVISSQPLTLKIRDGNLVIANSGSPVYWVGRHAKEMEIGKEGLFEESDPVLGRGETEYVVRRTLEQIRLTGVRLSRNHSNYRADQKALLPVLSKIAGSKIDELHGNALGQLISAILFHYHYGGDAGIAAVDQWGEHFMAISETLQPVIKRVYNTSKVGYGSYGVFITLFKADPRVHFNIMRVASGTRPFFSVNLSAGPGKEEKAVVYNVKNLPEAFDRVLRNAQDKGYLKLPAARSEMRIKLRKAALTVLRTAMEENVPESEREISAGIIAKAGAAETIRELAGLKTLFQNQLTGSVNRTIDGLMSALAQLPEGGVDIAYSVKGQSAQQMRDFVDAVKRLGRIKRVLISKDEQIPAEFTASLREAGILVTRVNLGRPGIEFSGDQTHAGLVASSEVVSGPALVPVLSLDTELLDGSGASRLVIALQTAVALLVAEEVKKGNEEARLKPAELLQKYKLFEGFEKAVISSDGRNIRISGAGVMAFLQYQTGRMLARSA